MLAPIAMAVAILMPAFNDPVTLVETLRGVRESAATVNGITVVLVDDGSDPPIDPASLPSPTGAFQVVLARHAINLGQGAALETARRIALSLDEPASSVARDLRALGSAGVPFAAYVTMDSDGQHRSEDLRALVTAIALGADVALGDRFSGESNVPAARRALLKLARVFERALTGLRLSDAHNGYRAFSRRALVQVQLRENRMAHATELTLQISRATRGLPADDARPRETPPSLKVVEVPVSVRYTAASLAKGQTSLGAFTILRDLFYRYLFEEHQ